MINKLKNITDSSEISVSKIPNTICTVLVYVTTLFLQNSQEFSLYKSIFFTIVMAFYFIVYLLSDRLFKNKYWLYFGIQGAIIVISAFIMNIGNTAIFIGLIPILISQSIGVYYHTIKVVLTFFFFYILFLGTVYIINGGYDLAYAIPLLLIISIAVVAYSTIFYRQIKIHIKTQKVLKELEFAYEKVEDLTLANERQRMARDLHDTLAQGLAGTIMQLDAVKANLNKSNTTRALEIVDKAMIHARETLTDSRLIIDDLRLKGNFDIDFISLAEKEIAYFKEVSNFSITSYIDLNLNLPLNIVKHCIYIIRECLNNVVKHADAKSVVIEIKSQGNKININITDDGKGFDIKILNQIYGHYGLIGITERVHALNGEIKIKSKKKSGTNIDVLIPIIRES